MAMRLIEIIEQLPACRVLLIGDFMMDKYVFGKTERVSPEAPIPVLRFHREEWRPGGAGFVLAGLAALGAQVTAVGVVGADDPGERLVAHLAEQGGNVEALLRLDNRPTVTKVRLLGSSEDKSPQQMIRLDIEESRPVDDETAAEVLRRVEAALDSVEMLCIEDYDKGLLTPDITQRAIAMARQRNIPIMVDPARLNDYGKYRGATMLKVNRPETERATGMPVRTPEQYRAAAEHLLSTLDLEVVVITLNDLGSYLATRDGRRELLTSRKRQVADPTGAGDMVLATLCMTRAAGADWHEAVALANAVGGLEVEKVGCVPITRDEIIHDLLAEHRVAAGKQRTLEQLIPELRRHRDAGKRIVFTNGCFDLIHLGHVKYFQFAKAQGDLLVVGVNTDASICRLKGPKRPIINEHDRISVLEELESIDYLVRFDEDTPLELIQQIRPDVLVKGADYQKEQVVGWDFVESCGGRIALAPLIDGRSTSAVISRILDAYK